MNSRDAANRRANLTSQVTQGDHTVRNSLRQRADIRSAQYSYDDDVSTDVWEDEFFEEWHVEQTQQQRRQQQQQHQRPLQQQSSGSSEVGPETAPLTPVKVLIIPDSSIIVAGGHFSGKVEVHAENTIELLSINARLAGREGLSGKDKSCKSVLDMDHLIGNRQQLQKGKVSFQFSFNIPDAVPSSFTSSHAYVIYKIEIDCRFLIGRIQTSKVITVHQNIGNYASNEERHPSIVTANGSKSFFMAGSRELNATATINRSLHQCGEPIIVNVLIENPTKRKIAFMKLQLVRLITIGSSPDYEKVVDSVSFSDLLVKVDPNETRSIILHMASIPMNVWSVHQTQLFKVTYVVNVVIEGSLVSKNLEISLPIRIAHPVSCNPGLIPGYLDPERRGYFIPAPQIAQAAHQMDLPAYTAEPCAPPSTVLPEAPPYFPNGPAPSAPAGTFSRGF